MSRTAEEAGRGEPRIPPHNLEAEQSVLGSMMLSPEAFAAVLEVVKAGDFYRPAHQRRTRPCSPSTDADSPWT